MNLIDSIRPTIEKRSYSVEAPNPDWKHSLPFTKSRNAAMPKINLEIQQPQRRGNKGNAGEPKWLGFGGGTSEHSIEENSQGLEVDGIEAA